MRAGARKQRHVVFDGNYWKSRVYRWLGTPKGDKCSLTLPGTVAHRHRMFIGHCLAEYPVETRSRGRTVEEWKLRSEKPDNHLWDCLVGAAVGASMSGAKPPGEGQVKKAKRKRRWSEIQREKMGKR